MAAGDLGAGRLLRLRHDDLRSPHGAAIGERGYATSNSGRATEHQWSELGIRKQPWQHSSAASIHAVAALVFARKEKAPEACATGGELMI